MGSWVAGSLKPSGQVNGLQDTPSLHAIPESLEAASLPLEGTKAPSASVCLVLRLTLLDWMQPLRTCVHVTQRQRRLPLLAAPLDRQQREVEELEGGQLDGQRNVILVHPTQVRIPGRRVAGQDSPYRLEGNQ